MGFAATGRADEHDVRLLELDIGVFGAEPDPLIVVVDADGDNPFCALLPDDVLVEHLEHVAGCRGLGVGLSNRLIVGDDLLTPANAFVADEDLRGSCD